MSAGKLTWGRRDWLGLMVLFLSSIAADVIGALLAVKGILPMGSVAAWVYGGWAHFWACGWRCGGAAAPCRLRCCWRQGLMC